MSPAPRKPRGVLIAGNWKMNNSAKETKAFFEALKFQAAITRGHGGHSWRGRVSGRSMAHDRADMGYQLAVLSDSPG